MPTFDYRCTACGQVTEVFFRRASDTAPAACPACGAKGLERMLCAPNVIVRQEAGAACHACPSRSQNCTTGACAKGLFPQD